MKQQKQETLMRRANSEIELTNDAIRVLRRLSQEEHWRRVEPHVGTATQLETEFMPEMLRLIRDIERLERLTALRALSHVSTAGAPYRTA